MDGIAGIVFALFSSGVSAEVEALRTVKPKSHIETVLVGLHLPFGRTRPLKTRSGSAILEAPSVSIVLT